MKTEEIIAVLKNEQECVAKAACGFCDRDCMGCELVMEDSDIIGAYDAAIALLELVGAMRGRLIDSRALHTAGYEVFEKYADKSDARDALKEIEKLITGAPTVIPVEEGI